MDQKWKKDINDTLQKIETIGFFAAIGIHFAESTPLLSEELGNYVKGTPWETFSTTDQCFKMIHQLAFTAWKNLEGYATFLEPKVEEEKGPEKEIMEPEEPKGVSELPSDFQRIVEEIHRLKAMGESLAGTEKQASELDHEQVKSLGEMIIDTATTLNKDLQEQKKKISEEIGVEGQKGKPLELPGEELSRIKTFGSCLMAMGMAFHEGYKLNPRQIETMGQMIVDLAAKVAKNLNLPDPPSDSSL